MMNDDDGIDYNNYDCDKDGEYQYDDDEEVDD